MLADAIQSGAEDDGVAHLRVKQRLHTKVIPRAEQALARPVPYGKCEITKQVLDTFLAPGPVGPEQQFNVGHAPVHGFAARGELPDQVGLRVHARVRDDPHVAIQRERLGLAPGFFGGSEQRVAEADVAVYRDPLLVRPAEGHEVRHPPQERAFDRCAVEMDNADDSAHCSP